MEPTIGITCSLDRGRLIRAGKDYAYVRREYAARIREAGGNPVLVTPDLSPAACAALCRGLVITGGDDLPRRFDGAGDQWDAGTVPEDTERIEWERALLDQFSGRGAPVLGVCYGMQLMNLHWGGTIHFCDVAAHGGQGAVTQHQIELLGDLLPLGRAGERFAVSSSHRQAVERLAPGARALACATDGTVEALERDACFGVQWHPETDHTGAAIYERLASACRA